jgi:hypothetical protein
LKARYILLPSVLLLSACGQQVSGLTIDQDGCLDGGRRIGKYRR